MTLYCNLTHAGRRLVQLAVFLTTAACALANANVTISWNPNPEASLAGYGLYYGTASRNYPNRIPVSPTVTSNTIANLQSGQTYYFAVTATNLAGNESPYSTEVSVTIPTVNNVPVANAQSVTTPEDVAKAITLTGTDADGNTLSYALVTTPINGTLTGTAPNLTYRPATNFSGADSFTFRVNDGTTNSATAAVSITVIAVNDPPVAIGQSTSTTEDTAKSVSLAGSDIEGNPLTYAIVTSPTKGTLTGTGPTVTYRPATNYAGPDSFSFRVNDGSTSSAPATVNLTITAVNDPPTALAQSVATAEDTAKAITLTGSDVEGSPLSYSIVNSPTKGTLTGTAPNLTYTPNANFNGADSFTFRVNDGSANSAAAAVSLTITPVNDAPVALAQLVSTERNLAKAITLTGSDVDGDSLSFSVLTQPAQGTLTGTAPNLTYTPDSNVTGADSFTFRVNDGTGDSPAATVNLNIQAGANIAPVANSQNLTNAEDNSLAITLTGSDWENDALTFAVLSLPTNGVLSGTAPNLIYLPDTNFNGGDSFTFRVNDGSSNSAAATVSLTVTPANDVPTALAQSVSTTEDTVKAITLTGSDDDGNALTFSVLNNPTKGTLSGTAPNLTYTPNANYSGTDSFTFRANDGSANSAAATVTISVAAVNDAPTANPQSVTTAEDTAKAITLTGSDLEGSPLTYTIVSSPTKGILTGSAPNVTYTPNANFSGTDSFTFRVNDGSANSAAATVNLTINALNDAPTALAQSVTTTEDTAKAITLTGSDLEGSPLTYTIVSSPTKGILTGSAPNVTYTPNVNLSGADSFTFRVNDGSSNSAAATVSLTITPVNDAPIAFAQSVATDRNVAKPITLTGSDVDGDSLAFTVLTTPANGTLTGTAPNLTYTPDNNFSGLDSFTFRVNDGTTNSAAATVSINIASGPNTTPVALAQSINTPEDTAKAITLTGSDDDGNALTFSVLSSPAKGTLSGTAPNLTYTPNANYSGADSFTFRVNDGTTNSAAATISLNVVAVNDAPTLNSLANLALVENAAMQTIALAGITSGATDESQTLTVQATSSDPGLITVATVNYTSPATTGSLQLSPLTNASGNATITVTVNDGGASNNLVTRTFTVSISANTSVPVVALTSPGAGDTYNLPSTLNLSASVDPQGQAIHRVQFFAGANLVGEVTNAPYHFAWLCETGTTVTLTARAIYGSSQLAVDSAPVTISLIELPGAWEPATIGEPAVAGRTTVTNEVYYMDGAGVLTGNKDSFQYVHQPLLNDGSITIRIDTVNATNNSARTGIMMRESLTPNARYAFIGVSPDGYIRWQRRSTTGGTTSSSYYDLRAGNPRNVWVRLQRVGNTITSYRSTDGVKWARVVAAKVTMAGNINMGLVVASGVETELDRTTFSNPTLVP